MIFYKYGGYPPIVHCSCLTYSCIFRPLVTIKTVKCIREYSRATTGNLTFSENEVKIIDI